MTNQMVSVVIPAFNSEATLPGCIRSIVAQTFEDFEVIVVDDCSSDDTSGAALLSNDPRIQVVSLKRNGGPSAARNEGIRLAKGKWIAFVDADDQVSPDHLKTMIEACEKHDLVFCTPRQAKSVPDKMDVLHSIEQDLNILSFDEVLNLSKSNFFEYINCVFVLVDREFVIGNEIFFPEGMDGADWTKFMFALLLKQAPGGVFNGPPTYLYRVTGKHYNSSFKSIRDQAAGLKAIAGDPRVDPETREKIAAVAKKVERRLVVGALREKKYRYAMDAIGRDPVSLIYLCNSLLNYVKRQIKYFVR